MSKFLHLLCIFMAEILLISAARNNGYFRAFRRGYYPGKPVEYHRHSSESTNYYDRGYSRPNRLYYERQPMFYAFPVYPYFRYGEPDESIYDYKIKMKTPEAPTIFDKVEVHTAQENEQKVKDMMTELETRNKMDKIRKQHEMKMKEQERKRKMMLQAETVHKPTYRRIEAPKMEAEKKPVIRNRVRVQSTQQKPKQMKPQRASTGGLIFNGKYGGSCANEGLYYRDESSYVICTNAQAIVQPCAPGTHNEDLGSFSKGSQYSQFDFCTVNLVARGGYQQMMSDEDRSRTTKYMNQRVKNYFEKHFNNYT